MHLPKYNMSVSGTQGTVRRHSFSGGDAKIFSAPLRAARQADVQPSPQPGHATEESETASPSAETQNAKIGEKVTNVRGFSYKNKANNATSGDSPFNAHEASELNDIVNSLDSASTYLNKKQCEAINFVSKQVSSETFDKLQAILSDPGSRSSAVDKAKQAFVMLKMLNDSSAKSDTPNTTEIKKDIDFFVDKINKYGLGTKSPFAGSLLQGIRARSSIDDRLNKTAGKLIAEGLSFNADIDGLVESKINAVQDKDIRATLLSKWKGSAFRPSKLVFDKMEETINESRNFHRIDTLLNHQPIQLELFKAFLQHENPGQNNDASKTGSPTPNKGMSNGASERPINYYDFSVNDNSIHITDGSRISLNEAVDPPKGQEEKSPASATERQNVTPVPDKQSDRSTDGQGDSGGQKRPTATTGMSATTTNSNRPSNETQTPSLIEGGHAGFDDIDGPALQREASSTPDINAEPDVRTSVQQKQSQRVGNQDYPKAAHHTSFIGPFSTGRTGAAQFQKYKQSASITSNGGRFDKTNVPPITSSNDADTGINNDAARLGDENPSPHASESRPKKWDIPSPSNFLITSRTGGLQGPAELKRYRQEGNIRNNAKNNTQAGRREPLPGQPPQFGETLTNPKRNAAIVESSEPRPKKWDIPSSSNFLVTTRTGALQGAAEAYRYWRSAPPAQAIDEKQLFGGAAGINKQKSDILIGSHRTGRTGAADFKKYVSNSDASTVSHTQNSQSSIGHGIEPETRQVEITDDGLLADTVPNISASRESSLANRHQVASSGERNPITAAGNTAFKSPFWAGGQGAAAKQAYIEADRSTKKVNR